MQIFFFALPYYPLILFVHRHVCNSIFVSRKPCFVRFLFVDKYDKREIINNQIERALAVVQRLNRVALYEFLFKYDISVVFAFIH